MYIYIYTILLVPRLLLRQPFGQMEAPRIPITLCIYKELCFFIQDPHIPNNATFLCPWDGDGGAAEKQNQICVLFFQIAPKMHLPDFFCAATGQVPKRASALLGQNRWQIEGAEKCVWGSPQPWVGSEKCIYGRTPWVGSGVQQVP